MSVEYIKTEGDLPPVAVVEKPRWTPAKVVLWVVIALIAGAGWSMIAFVRGEELSASWFVAAAVGSYLIGFRFYAKLIEWKICRPNPKRATPAELNDNGRDFAPTDRRVLFGHHFAAISGAGPLVGPLKLQNYQEQLFASDFLHEKHNFCPSGEYDCHPG